MKTVHQDLPNATFTEPSGIVQVKICKKSGCKASSSCSDTYVEYFAEGSEPKTCEGHSLKTCTESGKLATEYCPNTQYLSFVPEKERNPSWKTNSSQNYSAPSEYCTIHTSPEQTNNNNNNNDGDNGVDVTVSTDIVVPDVVGKKESAAKKELKNLRVEVKYKSDNKKDDGVVISQSISSGTVVAKDTKITITVNKIENKKPEKNEVKNETTNNTVGDNKNTTEPTNTTKPPKQEEEEN